MKKVVRLSRGHSLSPTRLLPPDIDPRCLSVVDVYHIYVTLVLNVMLNNGFERNQSVEDFLSKAKEDKNDLLVAEAMLV